MKVRKTLVSLPIVVVFLLIVVVTPVFGDGEVAPGQTRRFMSYDRCQATPFEHTELYTVAGECEAPNRVKAFTAMSVDLLNATVPANAAIFTDFHVTGTNGALLSATVTAAIDWRGVISGIGVAGTGGLAKIELLLVDRNTGLIRGSRLVMINELDSLTIKKIDVGGNRIIGSAVTNFNAFVIRGHDHSIILRLTCESQSGILSGAASCNFSDFGRSAGWTELTITVSEDQAERLDLIDQKLDVIDRKLNVMDQKLDGMDQKLDGMNQKLDGMDQKLDGMDQKLDLMNLKLNEVIRLLLTPQGRRSTTMIDCGNRVCRFPLPLVNPSGKSVSESPTPDFTDDRAILLSNEDVKNGKPPR